MMRRIASLVALLLFAAMPAMAQEGSITGLVTDATTGEPVPGVNIILLGLDMGTATDAQGQYTLTRVPAGTHTIQATYIGYETYEARITVSDGEALRHNIAIEADVIGLSELVV